MTEDQQRFLDKLIEKLTEETRGKFEAGVTEYGTKIWEMPIEKLLDETIKEAIDQYVYLYTVRTIVPSLIKQHVKQLEADKTFLEKQLGRVE